MLRSFVVVVLVSSALALTPASVAAQGEDHRLSFLLPQLYLTVIQAEADAFVSELSGFTDPDQVYEAAAKRFRDDTFPIIGLAGNQLSSFPLASASGGFTWTIDTASGLPTRTSNSFGPIFAERPLTIGRRRLNVGANFQHVTFDHLEERSLGGGEIVSYLSVPFLINDYIFFANSLDLKVTSDTLNAFATYGVTDRLDIGVAVPINRVEMKASLSALIGATFLESSNLKPFVTSTAGKKTGIGDVVIRAKYNIFSNDRWGISESVDVRVPTGDELNLLGIAGPQVKLTLITSSALGLLSPHANVAYTISGSSDAATDPKTYVVAPAEEINYAAGADLALWPRATVAADVVGRIMRKAGTMTWGPAFGTQYPQYQQFDFAAGRDLHVLLGSVGLKINPFKTMLFTANVLFPITKNGLTDRLTWMAGLDYSF